MQDCLGFDGISTPDCTGRARFRGMTDWRFRIIGHLGGSYSLAAVNRDLALALDSVAPGRVQVAAVAGWREWRHVPRTQFWPMLRLRQPPSPGGRLITISQHYPLHVPRDRGDVNLALFFWEESLIPRETIERLNHGFDGVLAPTHFVADALLRSGLRIPVDVVGLAPDLTAFCGLGRTMPDGVARFLHVSSGFPRKGVDVLLRAYATAFRAADPVELVIKTFPNPHNQVAVFLGRLREAVPDLARVRLIEADLPQAAMLDLYRQADAMVLPSRGEGFNLPAAEAMAAGVPVIVSEIGGHADFCTHETARLVPCRLRPSQSHLSVAGSLWAEPDAEDLACAMREILSGGPTLAARAGRARAAVAEMTPHRLLGRITAAAERLSACAAPPWHRRQDASELCRTW